MPTPNPTPAPLPAATTEMRIPYDGCPLCRAKNVRPLLIADCTKHALYDPALPPKMTWCRCDACGHVFTDGYFTEAALAIVFRKTNESQKVGYDLEKMRFVSARMIEKVLAHAPAGRWLDVGFGNGSLLFTAEEYGFAPVGIDLRPGSVATMREVGIEAHVADIRALDHPGRYAVISMADVLEHMPFPAEGLIAAHRLLQAGGVLFVSMPNADSVLWKALDDGKANPYWGELEHYHNFGRKRFYKLLAETGFEPVRYGISERYRAGMEVIARKIG